MGGKASNPQNEPKARGVKSSISNAPEYIGWRNTPYAPVEITFCTIPTSIVAVGKAIRFKEKKNYPEPKYNENVTCYKDIRRYIRPLKMVVKRWGEKQ